MSTVSIIIALIGFAVLMYGFIDIYINDQDRERMKKKEARLAKSGIFPNGSSLSEGIVYNKKTGKYESDQTKSAAWYKRLQN